MLKRHALQLLLASPPTVLLAQGDASLRIEVNLNKKDLGGRIMLAVCPDSASFGDLQGCRLEMAKAVGPTVVFELEGLSPGDHAIRAYQDVDGDGKLDENKLHIPTEPFGFSNDAMGAMGPPTFKQAKFNLKAGKTSVTMKMRGG